MRITENRLRGYVPYFLCNGYITHYKHIKIWGVQVYKINGRVTGNNLDNISNIYILWGIQLPKVIYYTENQTNHFIYIDHIMHGLMNKTNVYFLRVIIHTDIFKLKKIQKHFFRINIFRSTWFHVKFISLTHPLTGYKLYCTLRSYLLLVDFYFIFTNFRLR